MKPLKIKGTISEISPLDFSTLQIDISTILISYPSHFKCIPATVATPGLTTLAAAHL